MRSLFTGCAGLLVVAASPLPSNPDPARLKANVEKLVSFGTRHTLSFPTHPKRGIGAARRWAASEFARLSKACSGCIMVEMPSKRFDGPRAPEGVEVVDVLGVQRGSDGTKDVVIVAGHIDSRVTDPVDFTSDAPGANDDGSGTSLVLEAARILSTSHHRATIVYAILSGEEQGLWGGRLLAETAKAKGWTVLAMLNNDIVGNSVGTNGRVVADRVRVFSEGIRFSEDEAAQRARRGNGGEDDGPSRALAKAVSRLSKSRADPGFEAFLVRRPDRFGRGGDHLPMLEAGFPAVRFSVGVENYDAQHQDVRSETARAFGDTVDRMDFAYLAKVTALNLAVIRELSAAPAPPALVTLGGAVSADTPVRWSAVPGAAGYRIHWRRADKQDWTESLDVEEGVTTFTLKDVVVDDHLIGVAALSSNGAESLVTFGGLPPRSQ